MTKNVAEDKLKKIWETWKMPTSNPFYFDVKSLIDEIIDGEDVESKPTIRTWRGNYELSLPYPSKPRDYARSIVIEGHELGFVLQEMSVQLSDGYFEGDEDEPYKEFWEWLEFTTSIHPDSTFIWLEKPNKYKDTKDIFSKKSDLEILEYIKEVFDWMANYCPSIDMTNEYEKSAYSSLIDTMRRLEISCAIDNITKKYKEIEEGK